MLQHLIVGLGGQVFIRPNSQDAVREFRPYFDNAPVYGHGPSLEEFTRDTPLFAEDRPATVPDAPAHASLVAQRDAETARVGTGLQEVRPE